MSSWAVIGDGTWGRALAARLVRAEHTVALVGEKRYRGKLPAGVTHSLDGAAALAQCERVLVAVPTAVLEPALTALAPAFGGHHRVCTTGRGLTPEHGWRASEAVLRLTGVRQVAVLAGAAEAATLEADAPAALVVGSAFSSWSDELQAALTGPVLRVYSNPDPVGVELANALAAVVGVALTAARALGVGGATEATALTRAVAELDRVTAGLGGQPNTAFGLAGLGVLATFVFEAKGQVYAAGSALAKGDMAAMTSHRELAEIASTLRARARKQGIRAPMLEAVGALFAGELSASDALDGLMRRASRAE